MALSSTDRLVKLARHVDRERSDSSGPASFLGQLPSHANRQSAQFSEMSWSVSGSAAGGASVGVSSLNGWYNNLGSSVGVGDDMRETASQQLDAWYCRSRPALAKEASLRPSDTDFFLSTPRRQELGLLAARQTLVSPGIAQILVEPIQVLEVESTDTQQDG